MTDIQIDVGDSLPRGLLCFFGYKTAFFPLPCTSADYALYFTRFCENISKGFRVIDRTSFVTDIWMDVGDSLPRGLLCFFGYKTAFFPFQNNPKKSRSVL